MLRLTTENPETGRTLVPHPYQGAERVPWIYLHGSLEEQAGFDICHDLLQAPGLGTLASVVGTVTSLRPRRVEPCRVYLPDGGWRAAHIYLWLPEDIERPVQGLVVRDGDTTAAMYAASCMSERRESL